MPLIRGADITTNALSANKVLNLHLGPFVAQIKSDYPDLAHFLQNTYGFARFSEGTDELFDWHNHLRAPSFLRRYVKPQVIPNVGFRFPAAPLPRAMAPLALEMGLNISVALQCFRLLVLHAGAVADSKGGILISAASGGGKSTLTAGLMERGFRLLSDEFGLIDFKNSEAVPYPRPVSLKNQSIDVVNEVVQSGEMSPRLTETPKGDIAYRRARETDVSQDQVKAPVKLVLFPRFIAGAKAEIKKVVTGKIKQIAPCLLPWWRCSGAQVGNHVRNLDALADQRALRRAELRHLKIWRGRQADSQRLASNVVALVAILGHACDRRIRVKAEPSSYNGNVGINKRQHIEVTRDSIGQSGGDGVGIGTSSCQG